MRGLLTNSRYSGDRGLNCGLVRELVQMKLIVDLRVECDHAYVRIRGAYWKAVNHLVHEL